MKKLALSLLLIAFSFTTFSQDQIVFVRLDKHWQVADMDGNILFDKKFDYLWSYALSLSPPPSKKQLFIAQKWFDEI